MAKNIIKEIIIVLLLMLAIILVLGVLLYGYIPSNKIIPEKISYTTPEEAKKELETDVNEDDDELYIDYHVDSTQLNNYKRIQEYVPGKKNPFSSLNSGSGTTATNETNETSESNQSNNTSSSNRSTTQVTTNQAENTTENNTSYLPDRGTK